MLTAVGRCQSGSLATKENTSHRRFDMRKKISLLTTNYLYGMTKADGLTLGMFQAHRYMQQLTGTEEVKFDLRKFNWIGTMEKTEVMFFVRADAPYKSFDDVLKSSEPLRCGATGSTDGTYLPATGCCNHTLAILPHHCVRDPAIAATACLR